MTIPNVSPHSTETAPTRALPSWAALLGFVVVSHAAGAIGARIDDVAFYRELIRPDWAPPSTVFAPVWLVLYTTMGVAAWLVWRTPASEARRSALLWFAIQLAVNALWTPVFFGLRSLLGGLVVIVLLDVAIALTIERFARCSRPAAILMVPYAAWVAFATALNGALWLLNR